MEAQLRQLLNEIYANPSSNSPHERTFGCTDISDDQVAQHRMFVYKVVPCTRRGPHSWVECAFSHPGEKASRRDPQLYPYVPLACPQLKREGRCDQGDACMYSHSLFEYWLHPARYRTQLCSYGIECKRSICFFAHHAGELRVTEHTAQLLALEKELEGNDPTYTASNAKWGINNTSPKQQTPRQRQSVDGRAQFAQRGTGGVQHPQQGLYNGGGSGADVQVAQLRQLQALQAQLAAGLSPTAQQQAIINALSNGAAAGLYGGKQVHHNGAGMGQGNHGQGVPLAATTALIEAALQQQLLAATQPQLQQHYAFAAMNGVGNPAFRPQQQQRFQPPQQQEDSQLAATLNMLASLSVANAPAARGAAQAPSTPGRLQAYGSVPASYPAPAQAPASPLQQYHSVSGSVDNSDTMQALQLISQLQQLAGRAAGSGSSGGAGSDLQSVLLNSLPQLLVQLGGNAPAPTSAPASAPAMPTGASAQFQQTLQHLPLRSMPPPSSSYPTTPVPAPSLSGSPPAQGANAGFTAGAGAYGDASFYNTAVKCPPSVPNSDSPSPANALSVRTRHTAGSSVSSQMSDGTRSPPLSHHSDEGIWAMRDEDRWLRRPSHAGSAVEPIAPPVCAAAPQHYSFDGGAGSGSFAGLGKFNGAMASRVADAEPYRQPRQPRYSLEDADLATGMADMSGASAMIASLSQLLEGPNAAQA